MIYELFIRLLHITLYDIRIAFERNIFQIIHNELTSMTRIQGHIHRMS